MENKIMGIEEFCTTIKENLIGNMPESFHGGNYQVVIFDKKDDYAQSTRYFRVEDKKKKSFSPPELSLDTAYENYKMLNGDKEKILKILANVYGNLYIKHERENNEMLEKGVAFDVNKVWPMELTSDEIIRYEKNGCHITKNNGKNFCFCVVLNNNESSLSYEFVTDEMMRQSNIDDAKLFLLAKENVPKLLPLQVLHLAGDNEQIVKEAYLVKKEAGTLWEMYGTDVFEELATKTQDNLIMVRVGKDCLIVTPAESVYTLEECKDVAEEMAAEGIGFDYKGLWVYDRHQSKILTDATEMESCVKSNEFKRRSLFSK